MTANKQKFFVGDIVTVQGKIFNCHVAGAAPFTGTPIKGNEVDYAYVVDVGCLIKSVPEDKIALVSRRPIEVGDTVKVRFGYNSGDQGKVIAVHNGSAWVETNEGNSPLTFTLNALERVP